MSDIYSTPSNENCPEILREGWKRAGFKARGFLTGVDFK